MISKMQTSLLKNLNEAELILSTKEVIATEHAATTNVVRHFAELFLRRTHAVVGYSSMFQFAVEEFGYGKAAAQRRVNAMYLAIDVPGVLALLDERKMCLQVAADIQTFLNKQSGARTPYSSQQKVELVMTCANKSTRDVQKHLAALNPTCDFKIQNALSPRTDFKLPTRFPSKTRLSLIA